jgi:hypothetical protein
MPKINSTPSCSRERTNKSDAFIRPLLVFLYCWMGIFEVNLLY